MGVGSFAGSGNGKFIKLYSDVIINCKGETSGGIIGIVQSQATLDECWYDGEIHITNTESGGLVATIAGGRVTIRHSLFSGKLVSEHTYDATRTGGIVGRVEATAGLNVTDTLVSGEIMTAGDGYSGSVLGVAYNGAEVVFTETYDGSICNQELCVDTGTTTGAPIRIHHEQLDGIKAYQWTNLDFENYWAAIENDKPALKSFAEQTLELSGVEKEYDVSWYAKEMSSFTLSNAKQLQGFRMLASTTNFSGATIRLGNDIVINEGNAKDWIKDPKCAPENSWLPIGNISLPFAGTFDGQGHTISGLYINDTQSYIGLFGTTSVASILKNFQIKNSVLYCVGDKEMNRIGSVVGEAWGSIDSVYSDMVIITNGYVVGGIVGRLNYMDTTYHKHNVVNNCWYNGEIILKESGRHAGGIVGNVSKGTQPKTEKTLITISNCLNTATISNERAPGNVDKKGGQYIGGIFGKGDAVRVQMNNCLSAGVIKADWWTYIGAVFGRFAYEDGSIEISNTYSTNECRLDSVAYGPNGTITGGVIFYPEKTITGYGGYQYTTLDFEKYWAVAINSTPILKSFATKVEPLTGVARKLDISWYKEEASIYTIDSAEKLYGLSILSQYNDFEGKLIRLTKDIIINETDASTVASWKEGSVIPDSVWKPIGNTACPFAGNFDGQGHTISGIYLKDTSSGVTYNGLFGVTATGSKIQDFKIKNSYFERTHQKASNSYLGSVVGEACGIVESVYSDAVIVTDGQQVGGIVGRLRNMDATYKEKPVVMNCWFDGKIIGAKRYVGGIVGMIIKDTSLKEIEKAEIVITNCLNTGYINNDRIDNKDGFGGQYIGGIVGSDTVATKITIDSCVNAGIIDVKFKTYVGGIYGRNPNKESLIIIRNSYTVKECYNRLHGGIEGELINSGYVHTQEQMSDNLVYAYADLDFENKWMAVKEDTPILRSFKNAETEVNGGFEWFKDKKSPYVINDEKELYEFARLVNSGETFKGATVQLKSDMYLNGTGSEEWIPILDSDGKLINKPANGWTPMGDFVNTSFQGTFTGKDGDKIHSISGVYVETAEQYAGLFGYVGANGTVEYLKITNSYLESSSNRLGALVGSLEGNISHVYVDDKVTVKGNDTIGGIVGFYGGGNTRNISSCWYAGNIYGVATNGGGIAGMVYRGNKTLSNCLFTGELHATNTSNARVGGIVGYIWNDSSSTVSMSSCVSMGALFVKSPTQVGSVVGYVNINTEVTLTDVYMTDNCSGATINTTDSIQGFGSGSLAKAKSIKGMPAIVTADELKGNNAYVYTSLALGTSVETKEMWVATEQGPQLAVFSKEVPVYELKGQRVDTTWYYNEWTKDSGKIYRIDSVDDMYGFGRLVNNGVTTFAGNTVQLESDIDFNPGWTPVVDKTTYELKNLPTDGSINEWVAIGVNDTKSFDGIFTGADKDGDLHTIRGLYLDNTENLRVGLFGYTDNAIKDIRLEDSYIKSSNSCVAAISSTAAGDMKNVHVGKNVTVKGAKYVGGMIAMGSFSSKLVKISDCCFEGTLYSSDQTVGGIISWAYRGNREIINCQSAGTIISKPSSENVGGFIGYMQSEVDIKDSLFSGIINAQGKNVGGFVGCIKGCTNVEIESSRFAGDVKTTAEGIGGFVGYVNNSSVDIKKCATTGHITSKHTCGGFVGKSETKTNETTTVQLEDCISTAITSTTDNSGTYAGQLNGGFVGSLTTGNTTQLTSTFTTTRCVMAGKLEGKTRRAIAPIAGRVNYSAKYSGSDVYVLEDNIYSDTAGIYIKCSTITGVSTSGWISGDNIGWIGKENAGHYRLTETEMKGANAVENMPGLNIGTDKASNSIWIATKTGFPMLRIFAEKDDIYTIK